MKHLVLSVAIGCVGKAPTTNLDPSTTDSGPADTLVDTSSSALDGSWEYSGEAGSTTLYSPPYYDYYIYCDEAVLTLEIADGQVGGYAACYPNGYGSGPFTGEATEDTVSAVAQLDYCELVLELTYDATADTLVGTSSICDSPSEQVTFHRT